jgi:hypothetical protein
MTSDSWLQVPEGESERYHGRRRRSPTAVVARRLVAVGAILTATAATVLLVLDRGSLPAGNDLPAAPPVVLPAPSLASPGLSPTPTQVGTSSTPGVVVVAEPADPDGGPPAPSTKNGAGQPAPVVVEAESGAPAVVLGGSAAVSADTDASGGFLVIGIGASGGGQPGTIALTGSVPAAGTYRISIYLTNGEAGVQRSAEVSVDGSAPVTVSYGGRVRCCGLRILQADLGAGAVTVTLANPEGAAPSVDRIVLTAV